MISLLLLFNICSANSLLSSSCFSLSIYVRSVVIDDNSSSLFVIGARILSISSSSSKSISEFTGGDDDTASI